MWWAFGVQVEDNFPKVDFLVIKAALCKAAATPMPYFEDIGELKDREVY